MSRRHLTDDELADYVSTLELLDGCGKSLLPLTNEFAATTQALGYASLVQAAHFLKKHAGDILKPCTVAVAVDVFIQPKKIKKSVRIPLRSQSVVAAQGREVSVAIVPAEAPPKSRAPSTSRGWCARLRL